MLNLISLTNADNRPLRQSLVVLLHVCFLVMVIASDAYIVCICRFYELFIEFNWSDTPHVGLVGMEVVVSHTAVRGVDISLWYNSTQWSNVC